MHTNCANALVVLDDELRNRTSGRSSHFADRATLVNSAIGI
jgi:hypothetical protein